ncbi:MAG: hypothetical protein Q9M22_07680 [Mariprofundaceae bacterium]|nr:hypothetical protein [Mariprofundaceae bacterium]
MMNKKLSAAQQRIQLYNHVRGYFISQGSSLSAWSRERGVSLSYVSDVLKSGPTGEMSQQLLDDVKKAAGMI